MFGMGTSTAVNCCINASVACECNAWHGNFCIHLPVYVSTKLGRRNNAAVNCYIPTSVGECKAVTYLTKSIQNLKYPIKNLSDLKCKFQKHF